MGFCDIEDQEAVKSLLTSISMVLAYDETHVMTQECGRKVTAQAEIEAAVEGLMPEARQLWKPIEHWSVRRVRTGVRASPPRTEAGAMPLAGKLEGGSR